MSDWALELDDRTLQVAVAGTLRPARVSAPSRHWQEFAAARRTPQPHVTAAVAQDLDDALRDFDAAEALRIATPPRFEPAALGVLLGLLRARGRPVGAFIDSAAATAAALGTQRGALVVDFSQQQLAVARVEASDGTDGAVVQRRRLLLGEKGGSANLVDLWLDLVSDAMVRRTRFDPLHDPATEQALRAALPACVHEAARNGEAQVGVDHAGQRYEVTLSRDQFAMPAQPLYRELCGLLHELRPAGAALDIVVPQALAGLPGLVEALEIFAGCELRIVPDGFAARAASALAEADLAAAGVRLLRRLPVMAHAALRAEVASRLLGRSAGVESTPTHVLHAGKALRLGDAAIEVGRDAANRGIQLPEGLAGVSRFHCSLRRDGDAVVLVDCSRFGTFVNGERVAGRARLYAGDTVRIGDPGIELNLIAVAGH